LAHQLILSTQNFPPSVGGIETFMGSMVRNLGSCGWRITVMADGSPSAVDLDFGIGGIDVRRYRGLKPLRRRYKACCVANWALGHPKGLVVTDSYKSLELLPSLGNRVICFAHGTEIPHEPSIRRFRRLFRAFSKADLILANSNYTRGRLENVLGVSAPPVRVFNSPIELPPLVDENMVRYFRELVGKGPVILSLGRLEPRKGFDQVIKSMPGLLKMQPSVRLVIAGGGEDLGRLQRLAGEIGLEGAIFFLGLVSDAEKHALFKVADVFAMPARREGDSVEGYGLVFLEAGLHATPSVVGVEGGSADAIDPGRSGIVVNGSSFESVECGLRSILEDSDRLSSMSLAAKRHAESMLWPNRIKTLEGVLIGEDH